MEARAAAGGKAALALAAALTLAGSLASPAHATRYFAAAEIPRGPANASAVVGTGDEVSIDATGYGRNSLSGRYSGPGRTDLRGIFGRLGRFGSASLRFEPKGRPRRTSRPGVCTGGPRYQLTWQGTFTGSVKFTPDAHLHGFARKGSFHGSVATLPRWHCEEPGAVQPFDPHAGAIDVNTPNCDGRSFDANVYLNPVTPPPGDGSPTAAHFSASWTKSVGPVHVTYSIFVEGGPQTAVFADGLEEGTIRPPPPFQGEAVIRRDAAGAWSWSGSLSARFPGHTARLTGNGFRPRVTTYTPLPNSFIVFAFSERC